MSGIRKSPEIPQSVPKLEAELIRDAYETAQRGRRGRDDRAGDGTAIDLSDAEQQDFRRRMLDIGVSEETLSELGFDAE
ncbi:hypothetical protein [Haladaptatus cibarius]|uniref:hypothetical protein n=1 Tax=Haladaptatus cibarius TaxID=453847 RepID=UPI000679330A|nr:hypothetical protein [Haladaptatus cibarius]